MLSKKSIKKYLTLNNFNLLYCPLLQAYNLLKDKTDYPRLPQRELTLNKMPSPPIIIVVSATSCTT